MQQTKKLVTKMPDQTGKIEAYDEKARPREVYPIPFTKAAVDKLLEGKTPFGPDSVNFTDPSRVDFVAKITNVLGVQSFRCGGSTYEQFIEPEWSKIVEYATRQADQLSVCRFGWLTLKVSSMGCIYN